MQLIDSKISIRSEVKKLKDSGAVVGLVPTMGALHRGHLEIVRKALGENTAVVVSIFVNPTQFNDPSDLDHYPRTLEKDLAGLSQISEDIIVFAPAVEEMYSDGLRTAQYDFEGLDQVMEGQFRPGHFQGVATIVEKLLLSVGPDKAYFGEKDFQQLQIIRQLVKQRNIPVEIIGCDIIREDSGLAMSSRNERLTKRLRNEASFIFKTLKAAKAQFGTKSAPSVTEWVERQFRRHPELDLEYFVIANAEDLRSVTRKKKGKKYRGFVAVYADGIRLIDNLALN